MAQYWRVSPRIWLHPGWDDRTRLLALYLLTCEHRTTEGLFRLPKEYICADLGWTAEALAIPFGILIRDGFIKYDESARVIFICKALKYQRPDNEKQQIAAIRSLAELPETSLWSDFIASAEEYAKGFAIALRKAFPERYAISPAPTPYSNSNSIGTPAYAPPTGGAPANAALEAAVADETTETERPQQDQEAAEHSDESASIEAVYRHYCETWKDVFPRGPVLTPGRRRKLAARLKRWSVEELKRACDNMHANPFFRGDNDRGVAYGTLDYLVRSDENVDRLLTAPPRAAPAGKRAWQQFPESQERAAQEQEAVKRKVITL